MHLWFCPFVNFFFFFTFWPHHMTCGILVQDQGSNAHFLEWNHRVLTTGPPEKSLLICKFYRHWFNNTFKSLVGNRWLELTHARDRSGGRLAVSAHSHSAGGTNKNQSSYSPNPHSRYYIKGFLNRMKFLDLCKHIIFPTYDWLCSWCSYLYKPPFPFTTGSDQLKPQDYFLYSSFHSPDIN